ncbi:MAG: DUF5131 family protein [Burkholderiales bacterium]
MSERTGIAWTDHTRNFWTGCTKVGPGCSGCYAESFNRWTRGRNEATGEATNWGAGAPRIPHLDGAARDLRRWNAKAAKEGRRRRVFINSMSDFFDNEVPPEWRGFAWRVIRECTCLDIQMLTKRAGNILGMLPADWGDGWPHVWLGSTVINQEEADRDIPKLLSAPAAVRFLSIEPMLGPIDLTRWLQIPLQVGDHLPSKVPLDDEVRGDGAQEHDAISNPAKLPCRDRLPPLLGGASVVPSDAPANARHQPVHDFRVGVVDRDPGAVCDGGVPAPIEIALAIEKASDVRKVGVGPRDRDSGRMNVRPDSANLHAPIGEPPSECRAADAGKPRNAGNGLPAFVSRNDLGNFHARNSIANGIGWVIVGGESDQPGHRARPFVCGWGKDIVRQCRAAGVPVFVKQIGDNATNREGDPHPTIARAGADPQEWPQDLRIRELPA